MDKQKIILEILRVHKLSKAKLARKLLVSTSTIFNWLNGSNVPMRHFKTLESLGYISIETIPEQVKIQVKPRRSTIIEEALPLEIFSDSELEEK